MLNNNFAENTLIPHTIDAANHDFLNNSLECFLDCTHNKKLILFGAGDEMCKAHFSVIKKHGLNPAYIVDNDFRKWYSYFLGYQILEPAALREEAPDETVVLITSIYPFRVREQIKRLGIIHYFSSVLFADELMGKHQFMVWL